MSSLTVEMGLRRRRGDSPPIPRQVANRDDVTLAQKQRLAVLAKMGVGPIASAERAGQREPLVREAIGLWPMPPAIDRRAMLLEKEHQIRALEEQQRKEEEQEEQAKREKRARPHAGLARLGPVMPREELVPLALPTPAPTLEIKLSKETVAAFEDRGDKDNEEDEGDADGGADAEGDAGAAPARLDRPKRRSAAHEEPRQKPGRKKRKRRGKDGDWEDVQGDDDDDGDSDDEVQVHEQVRAREHDRKAVRDGGISKQTMVVESVKGKVSHANKNFTDADLERRFQMQEGRGADGSLMTEEEVLKLLRREKQERGAPTGSASKRVQRELAEWAAAKEQQRARVKSPHRFERMVVSRK